MAKKTKTQLTEEQESAAASVQQADVESSRNEIQAAVNLAMNAAANPSDLDTELDKLEMIRQSIINQRRDEITSCLNKAWDIFEALTKKGIRDILNKQHAKLIEKFSSKLNPQPEPPSPAGKEKKTRKPRASRDGITTNDAILKALEDGASKDIQTIINAITAIKPDAKKSSVNVGLATLKKAGKIESLERGYYSLKK